MNRTKPPKYVENDDFRDFLVHDQGRTDKRNAAWHLIDSAIERRYPLDDMRRMAGMKITGYSAIARELVAKFKDGGGEN